MKKYNLKKFNPLAIEKSVRLSKAQKVLFELICNKIQNKERLNLAEAKEVWLHHSCRDVRNGIPYFYNYWYRDENGEMVGRNEPMNEEQIKTASAMFLTHNIGRLVLKGFLKVIPEIYLTE